MHEKRNASGSRRFVGCALLAVVLFAPSVDAQQKGDKAKLAEAKKFLLEVKEDDVRHGGELCLAMNDVPAIELLLDVLRNDLRTGSEPHHRDIVWESLIKFTDPYARARVAAELAQNRKLPWMREWCCEALGDFGDAAFGKALLPALADEDDEVRRAAARAAGKLKFDGAKPGLANLVHHKDAIVRANALEALARIEPEKQKKPLLDAIVKDKDGGVRCALLAAAAELFPSESDALSTAALGDEDWRPRMQALVNLEKSKTPESTEGLIRATSDARPSISRRAVADLQKRTGAKLYTRAQWEKWSRDTKGGTQESNDPYPSEAPMPFTHSIYNDFVIDSDHVVFLIDHSGNMAHPLKSKGMSKSAAAKTELGRVLKELDGKIWFNVIAYADKITSLGDKTQPLNEKSSGKAIDFLTALTSQGSKDIWAALESAISDPSVDTIYLLSSGEPEIGKYVHWNRVTTHLADLNRFHRVVIHTIAYGDEEWYRQQLQKIAEATGGEFKFFP